MFSYELYDLVFLSDYNEDGYNLNIINENDNIGLINESLSDSFYNNYNNVFKENEHLINANKKEKNTININEEKTGEKTNLKENKVEDKLHQKKNEISISEQPEYYDFAKINNLLSQNISLNKFNEIQNNLVYDKNIENIVDNFMLKKKRERPTDEEYKTLSSNIENKEKENENTIPGKNKKKNGDYKHNKYSPDNMIKKIKLQLFDYSLLFLNKILYKYKENEKDEEVLSKLDYKIIENINQDNDLALFNMPLKDIFSKDTSSKFKKTKKDDCTDKYYNKKILEKILENETDETVIFALNMTFVDWYDVFTYKKDIKDIINKYDMNNNMNIDIQKIESCLIKVDELLKKKLEKKKDEFTLFTFYLFNYEGWFKNRKRRSKKNQSTK